jgi:predicted nucleic acid-binding protein
MYIRRPLVPSDTLAALRELVFLRANVDLRQVILVIDTNIVLRDLRWLVSRRRTPTARTTLQELIASETVIAFAPCALRTEVLEHVPEIALDLGVSEEELRQAWQEYEKGLHFYSVKPPADIDLRLALDPDDLPFLHLYQLVGASAVYTLDKHLPAMGAQVINPDVVLALRDYARAASLELTLKVGGGVVITAGIETIRPLVDILKATAGGFANFPKPAQFGLLFLGVLALAHPMSRKSIADGLQALPRPTTDSIAALAQGLLTCAETLAVARTKGDQSWKLVEAALQTPRRTPARVSAFAVCLAANKPLSISEIEVGMRQAGYQSKSNSSQAYLRKVLRRDETFIEGPAGYWSVQKTA